MTDEEARMHEINGLQAQLMPGVGAALVCKRGLPSILRHNCSAQLGGVQNAQGRLVITPPAGQVVDRAGEIDRQQDAREGWRHIRASTRPRPSAAPA